MDKISNNYNNFNNYVLTKNQNAAQDAYSTNPILLGLKSDVFQHGNNVQARTIAFGSTDKERDLIETLEETLEETYDNYSKVLKDSGIENIPKPTLKIDKAIDLPVIYFDSDNTMAVNPRLIKGFEKKCFLMKNGEIFPTATSSDDDFESPEILIGEAEAKRLAKKDPRLTVHTLGKDGAQMYAKALMSCQMTYWLEQMGIMNNPKTKKKYMNRLFKLEPELQGTTLKCRHKPELQKLHPFLNYKPNGALLVFRPEIDGKEVEFPTEYMYRGHLWYEGIDDVYARANPREIIANAGAASYLREKLGKGLDDDKLAALVEHFNLEAKEGYKDLMNGENAMFNKESKVYSPVRWFA